MGLNNEFAQDLTGMGRPWLVFDLETCPMPDCGEFLTDPIEAPSNYKDPAKIAAYVDEKRQRQIADAALDLDLCEIVAIGVQFHDVAYAQTRQTTSEADMLDAFWRYVRNLQKEHGALVGFNVLHFDLPVMLRRSLYLGVPTPPISVDRYRHDGIVDVADVLTFNGKMTWRSLAFYCKRFGIPFDSSVKGEQIPGLVAAGDWATIEAHVRNDIGATAALAQRVGVLPALVPVTEDAAAVA